jgi:hypothetical protein
MESVFNDTVMTAMSEPLWRSGCVVKDWWSAQSAGACCKTTDSEAHNLRRKM